MNIAVYLGSSYGDSPVYKEVAMEVGAWIANNNHTLVYGGSNAGTMGDLASSALEHEGKVIGVIPQFMLDDELEQEGLTELIVTRSMSERREKMIALSQVFIALPGGIGTLDEISEVFTNIRLHLIEGTVIIVNKDGFYDSLKGLLQDMVNHGFYNQEELDAIHFVNDVEEISNWL